jgi:hypothetical protein
LIYGLLSYTNRPQCQRLDKWIGNRRQDWKKEQKKAGVQQPTDTAKVVDSHARQWFRSGDTGFQLFVRENTENINNSIDGKTESTQKGAEFMKIAGQLWDKVDKVDKDVWKAKSLEYATKIE